MIIRPVLVSALFTTLMLAPTAGRAAEAQSAPASTIVVSGAWVREASADQPSTGGYLTIRNTGARPLALVGVHTTAAKTAELHTMKKSDGPMAGMSGMSGMGTMSGGMMTMEKVARIDVPAGGTVALAPGGFHLMLFTLSKALRPGDTVDLTLTFDGGVTRTVTAKVQSRAATTYEP